MEKITSHIKRLLSKNEKTAGKKRKIASGAADSTMTDEEMINQELKRRKTFAAAGLGKRAVFKKKKPGGK